MYLLLMRHGTAEDKMHRMNDFNRVLTPEGIREVKVAAIAVRRFGIIPEAMFTSSRARAKETAELFAGEIGFPVDKIEMERELAPEGDRDVVIKRVQRSFSEVRTVALVGHQPFLGELMSRLIFARAADGMHIAKGGVAIFNVSGSLFNDPQKMIFLSSPEFMV